MIDVAGSLFCPAGPSVLLDLRFASEYDRLMARREGVGSSDVAAVMGTSNYHTPLSLWADKTGRTDVDTSSSEQAEWGNKLEEPIAVECADRFGGTLLATPVILRSAFKAHHLASPDFGMQTSLGDGLIECKARVHPWNDGIDPDVYDQCQWQMHVTGHDRVWLAVLFTGSLTMPPPYVVTRNPERIALLAEKVDEFWAYVQFDEPPPPMARDAQKIEPTAGTLELDEESAEPFLALVRGRVPFKEAEKEAKRLAEAMDDDLKVMLVDHEEAVTEIDGNRKVLATFKMQERRSVDYDKMKEEDPEAYAKWVTVSKSRTLRPKKV